MLSKNELKYIQSLCQKKQRLQEGLFLAEGPKLAKEILSSDYRIEKLYATAEWLAENPINVDTTTVTEIELAKMSSLQTPNEVMLVCRQRIIKEEPDFKNTLSLVLDGLQDPGNLGTIIRIADWFGVKQIVASEDTVEFYNPKVIQSTMGSFIRVKCWYRNLPELLATTQVPVYGALLNGRSINKTKALKEGILVIGNESKGIREAVMPFITEAITIPRIGKAESLNAAVATGILLSHLCGKTE
ncbi:MAG: RNA methyltransferase [Chitinophagaceae bacterium]|nr:RNA methyltransferase [Chitinophagaceae bacterium]